MIQKLILPLVIVVHLCLTRLSLNWKKGCYICIYSLACSEKLYAFHLLILYGIETSSHAQNKGGICIQQNMSMGFNEVCHIMGLFFEEKDVIMSHMH